MHNLNLFLLLTYINHYYLLLPTYHAFSFNLVVSENIIFLFSMATINFVMFVNMHIIVYTLPI